MTLETDLAGRFRPEHVALLRQRAVSIETAAIAGLRSVSAEKAGKLLGWTTATPCAALAIPYLGVTPAYVRMRMDAGSARYLCPTGREVPIYAPPSILDAPEVEGEIGAALIVVEGPLKALSA